MEGEPTRKSGTGRQLIGSLLAAALIVALAVWAVTARLGPTSITEREAAEEAAEAQEDQAEEAAEVKEEAEEGQDERGGKRRRRGRD